MKMLKTFLKTNEADEIIWLDYCGYNLTKLQSDLTMPQRLVLVKGRSKLYEEMNKVKK